MMISTTASASNSAPTTRLALSVWLLWVHYRLLSAPGAGSGCNFGGQLNCNAVITSRFSEVFGVPIAYSGLVFYLTLCVMAASELWGDARTRALAYARGLGAIAVAYSVFLAVVSVAVIQAVCAFCIVSYVLNLASLGWWRPPKGTRFFAIFNADLRQLLSGLSAWKVQIAGLVIVAGAVGLARLGDAVEATAMAATDVRVGDRDLVAARGHTAGSDDAELTFFEFSDFECPYCGRASQTMERLQSTFGTRVRFVFKHFPLDSACNRSTPRGAHDGACDAATSAVCAGQQGHFWEYHERLFARGTDDAVMREVAEELDLDVTAWQQCRWGRQASAAVERDIEDGLDVGVRTTPTFLIGDQLVVGARSYEDLATTIRRELERVGF